VTHLRSNSSIPRARRGAFVVPGIALAACPFSLLVAVLAWPLGASAQAELTGDFIRYFGVGDDGTFINRDGHSMQYSESGLPPYSCDAFFPGSACESFGVFALAGDEHVELLTAQGRRSFETTSGPTVEDRTIHWAGTGRSGGALVLVSEAVTYESADRMVVVEVTVRNSGTVDLTDVFYFRNADPDFAQCSIGMTYETTNIVPRQAPFDSSSIVIASEAGVSLGLGTADPRARAHTHPGLELIEPSWAWHAPARSTGHQDASFALVFREPSLPAGASTTFTFYYVWGATPEDVLSRFDAVAVCPSDGIACSVILPGTCHGGSCCTGCFDGVTCRMGDEISACGAGGDACDPCDDANPCTQDRCDEAACAHTTTADGSACDDDSFCTTDDRCEAAVCRGTARSCDDRDPCTDDRCDDAASLCVSDATTCAIGGTCLAAGTTNPLNPCEICDPVRAPRAWTTHPDGTSCGEPSCSAGTLTAASFCSAAGVCVSGEAAPCPSGVCAGPTECLGSPPSDGGVSPPAGTAEGCGCSSASGAFSSSMLGVAVAALALRRKRR
jgi:hypothetical protein